MTYLDEIAKLIREQLPEHVAVPKESEHLFVLYAALVRSRGVHTSAADVHDAWAAWMSQRDPSHDSLIPFEQLAPDVQAEDEPFLDAIRSVARRYS